MEETYNLKKIQSLEFKIASEIKRICAKNNINYFLQAGTLLGAVRHGGFIPWDDDMDIGMLRDEYERFIEACKTDLGKEYFLQTWDTDAEYPFSYGKIRLNGTHLIEEFSVNTKANNGIFVDIFPYDNVPDDRKSRNKQAGKYFFFKRLLWIKKGYGKCIVKESFRQAVKYYFFYIFAHLLKYEYIKRSFRKIQTKYNGQITKKVVNDGAYGYKKQSIERKWVENLEPIKFETEDFLSFRDRIEYLQYFYGDYMKLPPVEKRTGHSVKSIDFGPFKDNCF